MRCQSWKIVKKLIFGDFARVCVQIDVFGSSSNLLGMTVPFQFFRPKNHFIPFKTWCKSHKIPILCLKNPTQIREMHFGELWKVVFMLLLAYKWPLKFAYVHFMVRLLLCQILITYPIQKYNICYSKLTKIWIFDSFCFSNPWLL